MVDEKAVDEQLARKPNLRPPRLTKRVHHRGIDTSADNSANNPVNTPLTRSWQVRRVSQIAGGFADSRSTQVMIGRTTSLVVLAAFFASGCYSEVSVILGDIDVDGVDLPDYATLELRAYADESACSDRLVRRSDDVLMTETLAIGELGFPTEYRLVGPALEPVAVCVLAWLDTDSNGWVESGDPQTAMAVELDYHASHAPAGAIGVPLVIATP